jgi:hypothetical protein
MKPTNQEGRGEKGKENGPLSARQEHMAAALASGSTVARACRECRVGINTVYKWKKLPAFNERVAELRRETVDRAIGRLSDMMAGAAADKLLKLLDAKSESLQLDAVKAVYELFINVTNAAELKARIEQLEANQRRRR